MDAAEQPGGLAAMSDEELLRWIRTRRAGLAAAEESKRGKKARRGWRESLAAAEGELTRRRDQA
jgi:hypothetical protein